MSTGAPHSTNTNPNAAKQKTLTSKHKGYCSDSLFFGAKCLTLQPIRVTGTFQGWP